MVRLPDGRIGLIHERGKDIAWRCFTQQWLEENDQ
jgi:hypothetical protein